MPSPIDPRRPQLPPDEAFLEVLLEALEGLDRPVRGHFLQRYFRVVAQFECTDTQALEYWERILARRRALSERMGESVSLKTAMVDVFASAQQLRVPILVEYEELKRLQFNAATDPLTGLYNRRFFEDTFEKELNRARRYAQQLTLVLLDLHDFKAVNDRYGHPRGDEALQLAALTLHKSLRASDYAFRIGGDEFALLLPQSDPEQADKLSRRLRASYESSVAALQLEVPLGMDYGLAVCPQDGDQKEVLVRVADERLYGMKQSARGATLETPGPGFPAVQAAAGEKPPERKPQPRQPQPQPSAPTATPAVGAPALVWSGEERRKWERVSMAGTRAYAQLGDAPGKTARVLDLGYGGVALQAEGPDILGGSFHAVLHVPILPPVRVSLRRVYALPSQGAVTRVGCSFVS